MIPFKDIKRIADQLIAYAEGEPFETISLDRDVYTICKRLHKAGVSVTRKAVTRFDIQKDYVDRRRREAAEAAKEVQL